MTWILFFAITLGLAMLAAHEQCSAESSARQHQAVRDLD